ncbi:hypothetical protein DM01DRAFT_1379015 [Hesseltinella vesiculosa]|uniref:Fungal-type protein kinase domain-containing protein n=1 Tax=Hesseltinella vesiculosa TaxID=101127 RepID=A0A1X2G2D4_9FUNG|nr:hypothetical protein DM01DRAFT_1379015 [Hesseltinella vesiculosa]
MDSQEYTMFLMVEQVISSIAAVIDVLFAGTPTTMADGEQASRASKTNTHLNKVIFGDIDTATTYGRKIDLLLRCDDDQIEVCSNEWKKSDARDATILRHQSKNLRTYATIINHILGPLHPDIDGTMAMYFIGGNTGYLYESKKTKDHMFIAKLATHLHVPKQAKHFDTFFDTLKGLLFFKEILCNMVKTVKKHISCKSSTGHRRA